LIAQVLFSYGPWPGTSYRPRPDAKKLADLSGRG